MSHATPHPDQTVKIPHLVMSLLFLGIAATWALAVTGLLSPTALPYLAPGLLVTAGLAGLLASAFAGRSRRRSRAVTSDRDHLSDTMDAPPAPTTRLEQHDPTDTTDDGEPTAPLYRPEDHR